MPKQNTITLETCESTGFTNLSIDLSDRDKPVISAENTCGEASLFTPEDFQSQYPESAKQLATAIINSDFSAFYNCNKLDSTDPSDLTAVVGELNNDKTEFIDNGVRIINKNPDFTPITSNAIKAPPRLP